MNKSSSGTSGSRENHKGERRKSIDEGRPGSRNRSKIASITGNGSPRRDVLGYSHHPLERHKIVKATNGDNQDGRWPIGRDSDGPARWATVENWADRKN